MNATAKLWLYTRRVKDNGKYPVKLKITFNREKRFFALGIDLTEDEFSQLHTSKKLKKEFNDLTFYLQKADGIIDLLRDDFSWPEFESRFIKPVSEGNGKSLVFFDHLLAYRDKLWAEGKIKTAKGYTSAYNRIVKFCGNKKRLLFSDITPKFLKGFEEKMLKEEMSYSSIGIYTRNIRTVFNLAISDKAILEEIYPFGKNKYSPPASRKAKKALSIKDIQKIYDYAPENYMEGWAKDMWLFAYFANGINVKDIALLKYENIQGDEIRIIRAKTEHSTREDQKEIQIILSDDLQRIIKERGNRKKAPGNYVFDIIKDQKTPEKIQAAIDQGVKNINKYMKRIGKNAGLEKIPTTNFARHSFSTVLKRAGVPIEMISEQLGHKSIKTTEIYLDSFEKDQKKELGKHLTAWKQGQ